MLNSAIAELSKIPIYRQILSSSSEFATNYLTVASTYRELLNDFNKLALTEVQQISEVLNIFSASGELDNSASKNTLPKLANLFDAERNQFVEHIISTIFPETETDQNRFLEYLDLTATSMEQAYQIEFGHSKGLVKQGETTYSFFDGDKKSDLVRWTYLQITKTERFGVVPFVHYFVSHLIDCIAVYWIKTNYQNSKLDEVEIDTKKDGALSILSDLLCYRSAKLNIQTSDYEEKTLIIWNTPRSEGGLGWIGKEKLTCFTSNIS